MPASLSKKSIIDIGCCSLTLKICFGILCDVNKEGG